MADSCGSYVSADDLKAAKQSILHIEHVATSTDANGNPALFVTDNIRGNDVTNTTLDGLFSDIGFKPVSGSFEDGGTINNRWEVLLYEANNQYYQWNGPLPKIVTAGSTPSSSGGVAPNAWVSQTDLTLRSQLAQTQGADLVNTKENISVQDALDRLYSKNDVRFYGARTENTDNSEYFIEAMSSSPQGIIVTGGVYNTSSIEFTSPVNIDAGSGLKALSGTTISFNDTVTAGNYQIFFGDGDFLLNKSEICSAYWFGASGNGSLSSAVTSAGSNQIVSDSILNVKNGQYVSVEHAGKATSLVTPGSVTVASTGLNRQGPSGSTSYAYRVSSVDDNGAISAASAAVSITDGNAVLGTISSSIRGLAFNVVRWDPSVYRAAVWRSRAGGDYQLLGVFGMGQSDSIANGIMDAGLEEVQIPWIPATPPDAPMNERLTAYVLSGAGTKNLTLSENAQTTAGSLVLRCDDTHAINKLTASVKEVNLPPGIFNVTKISVPSTSRSFYGSPGSELRGYGTLDAVVTVNGASEGFLLSGLTISPLAWQNQMGVQLDGCEGAIVRDNVSSGNLAIFMSNCKSCVIQNNKIVNWIDNAVFDYIGQANSVSGNYINAGCNAIPQNAAAIQGYNVLSCTYSNNKAFGKSVYSIKLEQALQCTVANNEAYNTWAESYHLAGSCSGNRITKNTMFGGDLKMDYAISISNDDRPNAVVYGNEVSYNYIYQCGTAAIAVCEFGGSNPSIRYNIIKGNTVFGANSNQQPDMPEIYIEGSGVSNTYISDHHSFSYPNVTHVVKEVSTNYGLPSNTQVGTLFGDGGSAALVSLTGTGSSKLSGGGTGL